MTEHEHDSLEGYRYISRRKYLRNELAYQNARIARINREISQLIRERSFIEEDRRIILTQMEGHDGNTD